ncbi:MAG TPA: MFS transporter [Burkholderiales bacterium]|nr:MFS transporter [Burkholderiales bacterium]
MIFVRVALPFIAGYFISYVYRMVNAVLGPTLAAEFGLTAGGLGLLSSVYFLSFAFFQLPLGLLLDRFGPRRVNATLLLIAALGGLWFASAHSAGAAIGARALIGVGVSGCLMSSFTAFVLWYPPDRLATMNGITFAAGALGAITATVPLELLLRVLDWRQVFLLLVAVTVLASLVLWLWVPERRRAQGKALSKEIEELASLFRDPAFLRLAVCLGASQCAAVALQTLWIATWLRDVGGYQRTGVAIGLAVVNIGMIVGYLGFGRAADRYARSGRSALPLIVGGVACSSLALASLALGVRTGALALWFVFVAGGTSVVLMYSVLSRRYPKEMAGRANTAINVIGFVGMFAGQWAIGLVLDLWPQSPAGYAPEAYPWALGMVWAVQLAGLLWLWTGRRLVENPA